MCACSNWTGNEIATGSTPLGLMGEEHGTSYHSSSSTHFDIASQISERQKTRRSEFLSINVVKVN